MATVRFAPSPTGALHLGHAYSALMAHDAARAARGRFLLRIDDLDTARVRDAYRVGIDSDLAWLGLVPADQPILQSQRLAIYRQALADLQQRGLAYPCFCTRAEIAASIAAPHGPDGSLYPGTCARLEPAQAADRIAAEEAHAWRLASAPASKVLGEAGSSALRWHDRTAGWLTVNAASIGDIVLARRDGAFAYHLASSVDDAMMGIDLVVRGLDLFAATHVHRLLQALLGLPTPGYAHHRLVADATGRRLAKRDDAASLSALREAGTDPAEIIENMRRGVLPLPYRWLDA